MTYATLHNLGDLQRKDLCIGDTVLVKRTREVIPAVVAPVLEKRPPEAAPWTMPSTCPSCGSPVVQPEGEAAVYCDNAACPAQAERRLRHYVSHGAADIESIGINLVQALLDAGLVHDPGDLYSLTKDQLVRLEHDRLEQHVAVEPFAGTQPLVDDSLTGAMLVDDKQAAVRSTSTKRLPDLRQAAGRQQRLDEWLGGFTMGPAAECIAATRGRNRVVA